MPIIRILLVASALAVRPAQASSLASPARCVTCGFFGMSQDQHQMGQVDEAMEVELSDVTSIELFMNIVVFMVLGAHCLYCSQALHGSKSTVRRRRSLRSQTANWICQATLGPLRWLWQEWSRFCLECGLITAPQSETTLKPRNGQPSLRSRTLGWLVGRFNRFCQTWRAPSLDFLDHVDSAPVRGIPIATKKDITINEPVLDYHVCVLP